MKNNFILLVFGCSIITFTAFGQVNPNFTYTQTCFGSQTTLVASSSLVDAAIASWQWDLNGDGIYEKSGKMIISLFTNDTTAIALKITPTAGSADSITNKVVVDPLPQPNFIASNLCEAKTATYISSSTITLGSITQSKWDFNNDGVDDAFGDTATYVCGPAQTYTTSLTCVSNKGCSAFTQKITTVYPNPTAAFTSSGYCAKDSTHFTNTSTATNLDYYLWKFGDGNQSATSGNSAHTYSSAGTFTVNLIAVTQEGCRDTTSSSITINPLPSVSITSSSATTFCSGNSVVFDAGSGFLSYQWSNGSSVQSTSITTMGNYSVTVTDSKGCFNTTSMSAVVNPLPIITITSNGGNVLKAGGNIQLIANGANNYLWNTGATANNINITQNGTYSVAGTDLNNCMASYSVVITNENTDSVSVSATILTPNDDGINDVLKIDNISSYSNCDLNIYNMWNEKVYNVMSYKNDWAGTKSNGGNLPAGPYYYIIKCDDKPMLKGNINILR